MRYVVTGASRGIGLEFCRQLLARGDSVCALARRPSESEGLGQLGREYGDRLAVHACDVADEGQLRGLAEAFGDQPVDVLVNNAGTMSQQDGWGDLHAAAFQHTLAINALAPVLATRALAPALRRGRGRKVINITSNLGSLTEATGGYFAYRMSKAALNMGTRLMAHELSREAIVCVALHPGWVQTEMGGHGAPLTAEASVSRMLARIDALDPADTGQFLSYDGSRVPW